MRKFFNIIQDIIENDFQIVGFVSDVNEAVNFTNTSK